MHIDNDMEQSGGLKKNNFYIIYLFEDYFILLYIIYSYCLTF